MFSSNWWLRDGIAGDNGTGDDHDKNDWYAINLFIVRNTQVLPPQK